MNEMAFGSNGGNENNQLGFVSPKGPSPSFHGKVSHTQQSLFNTSMHLGNNLDSRRSGLANGQKNDRNNNLFYQHKQSATNTGIPSNFLSSHYHTSNGNMFDDTEEGPLNAKANMNDYSFHGNSQHNNYLPSDHPFNQTNRT